MGSEAPVLLRRARLKPPLALTRRLVSLALRVIVPASRAIGAVADSEGARLEWLERARLCTTTEALPSKASLRWSSSW